MIKVAVMVPARNEGSRLELTIKSLYEIAEFAKVKMEIVVVDDGSKDNTADNAKRLECHVVMRDDRGYSALGRPELADTHNDGFAFIEENIPDYDYVMVSGANNTYESDYLQIILNKFADNPKLVMASGTEGVALAANAVRGSGRLICKDFWREIGCKVPNQFYSWESYPILYALSKGYHVQSFPEAIQRTSVESLGKVDYTNYGKGMREQGDILLYVLRRSITEGLMTSRKKRSLQLIKGYFSRDIKLYPNDIREFVRRYQWKRVREALSIFS